MSAIASPASMSPPRSSSPRSARSHPSHHAAGVARPRADRRGDAARAGTRTGHAHPMGDRATPRPGLAGPGQWPGARPGWPRHGGGGHGAYRRPTRRVLPPPAGGTCRGRRTLSGALWCRVRRWAVYPEQREPVLRAPHRADPGRARRHASSHTHVTTRGLENIGPAGLTAPTVATDGYADSTGKSLIDIPSLSYAVLRPCSTCSRPPPAACSDSGVGEAQAG